jgi:hypothetical protein
LNIDIGEKKDYNFNKEDTLVFAIDFSAMSGDDIAKWTDFVYGLYADEFDINRLTNYHSYTHWIRIWFD